MQFINALFVLCTFVLNWVIAHYSFKFVSDFIFDYHVKILKNRSKLTFVSNSITFLCFNFIVYKNSVLNAFCLGLYKNN